LKKNAKCLKIKAKLEDVQDKIDTAGNITQGN
jgi:hypothetical protein